MAQDREPLQRDQKIVVTKDGPYVVTGSVPLMTKIIANDDKGYSHHWRAGSSYPLREEYSLCRCGKSVSSPFCDGYHEKGGFDGTEVADHEPYSEKAQTIMGPNLVLGDYEKLCSSAKFCDRAGGIWNLTRQSGNAAAREIAITEAGNCPSGRLVAREREKGNIIEPFFVPSIGLIQYPKENTGPGRKAQPGQPGPIWVRGGIPVISADGTPYEIRNRQTLCRCGRSGNKPFCDSSHLDPEPPEPEQQ